MEAGRAVAEGTIITWRTDETIPVAFDDHSGRAGLAVSAGDGGTNLKERVV